LLGKLFRPREILDDLMPLEKAVGFVSFEPEGQPELVMGQPPLAVEFNEHRFLGHHIEVGEFPAELIFHRSWQVEADGHGRILVGPDDPPMLSDLHHGRPGWSTRLVALRGAPQEPRCY